MNVFAINHWVDGGRFEKNDPNHKGEFDFISMPLVSFDNYL